MEKVVDFLKKQSVGFYLSIASFLFILIGMIVFLVNGATEYYNDLRNLTLVPVFSVLAIVLIIAIDALSQFLPDKYVRLGWILVGICAMVAFMVICANRVESIAYIYGSDLENDNPLARPAVTQYFVGAGIYFVGILCAFVASFFTVRKEESVEKASEVA